MPDGWRAWHDNECATLTGHQEIGALQISAAFKETEVLDDDLRDFASEHIGAGEKGRMIQAGDFVGLEIAFAEDTNFWRHWYLRNGKQMLFVTYNCSRESRGLEDGVVDAALASLSASRGRVV